jgi:hypothetical protein
MKSDSIGAWGRDSGGFCLRTFEGLRRFEFSEFLVFEAEMMNVLNKIKEAGK